MKRINLTAFENIIKEQNKNTKIIINYKDNSTVFYINDNYYYLTNNGNIEAAVIEYLNNNNYRYDFTLGEDKEVYSYKEAVNAWNK